MKLIKLITVSFLILFVNIINLDSVLISSNKKIDVKNYSLNNFHNKKQPNNKTHTLNFYSAINEQDDIKVNLNQSNKLPRNTYLKINYDFLDWAFNLEQAYEQNIAYKNNFKYINEMDQDINIYALWQKKEISNTNLEYKGPIARDQSENSNNGIKLLIFMSLVSTSIVIVLALLARKILL